MRSFLRPRFVALSTLVSGALLAVVVGIGSAASTAPPALAPLRLRATVEFLASDALEGRKAGERGSEVAARFIASEFLRSGLRPAGKDGSFYQPFDCGVRNLGEQNALRIEGAAGSGEPVDLAIGTDFLPLLFSASGEVSGEVVFAGYGVRAPDKGVDDYAALVGAGDALRGKIVLVSRGLPFEGEGTDARAAFIEKARAAARAGAAAILVATRPKDGPVDLVPGREIWPNWNRSAGLLSLGASFATLFSNVRRELSESNMTQADITEETLIISQFGGPQGDSAIPAMLVSRRTADRLLGGPGAMDASLSGKAAAPLPRVTLRVDITPSGKRTANVIGWLEGSDERLRDEFVLIGAHYDHVGKNAAGEVWNGADDNASGTSVLLALADALAVSPPKRSVVFIAFGAEEKGLLGSIRYVDDPAFPLDKSVAMINLDMVGRNNPDHVTIIGARSSPEIEAISRKAASEVEMTLDEDGEEFFDRSDQASFYHHRVPVVFFCTMEHADYHKSTDTADKIDARKMARIAEMTYLIVHDVAGAAKPPSYVAYRESRSRGLAAMFLDPMFSQALRR